MDDNTLLQSLQSIFDENIAPALLLTKGEANICNGMSEEIAKDHRKFSELAEDKQDELIAAGKF